MFSDHFGRTTASIIIFGAGVVFGAAAATAAMRVVHKQAHHSDASGCRHASTACRSLGNSCGLSYQPAHEKNSKVESGDGATPLSPPRNSYNKNVENDEASGESIAERYVEVPEDAPEHCPGVGSEQAGKAEPCQGCPNQNICASGATMEDPSASEVKKRLANVNKKVLVLSGKGGVGKSTVSTQLSFALHEASFSVGLLDIDVCGPSIPLMTGCRGHDVHASADGWSPVYVAGGLAVMSIGFLLPNDDDAVIWRGPKKNGLIKQFLTDVTWGDLDLLIVDTPPGTSDEHLSIVTYLSEAKVNGAIIVTTPQEVALQDVRKEINFCKKVGIPVLGVVENMTDSVFDPRRNSTREMCSKMQVPYLGSVPLDRALVEACESGTAVKAVDSQSSSALALEGLASRVKDSLNMSTISEQPISEADHVVVSSSVVAQPIEC